MESNNKWNREQERREKLEQEIARQKEYALQQPISRPQLDENNAGQYDQLLREINSLRKCVEDLTRDVKVLKLKGERKWV